MLAMTYRVVQALNDEENRAELVDCFGIYALQITRCLSRKDDLVEKEWQRGDKKQSH